MFFRFSVLAPALAATAVLLASADTVSAHEERTVGDYELEVGFFEEPPLVNQLNGVSLGVSKSGGPVDGLDETLSVELIVGGGAATKEIGFEAIEGKAGSYVAHFVPTLAGDYTFRIFGDIEGTEINESFESGPGRFDPVQSLDEVAFPEAPADNASLAQSVKELRTRVDSLDSSSSDGTARALAVAGLVAGLAGLGLGGFAVLRRGP